MPVPKANQRAVNKYVKNNYDRINITMPKGKKDVIQAHAISAGLSVNAFINRAIDESIAKASPDGLDSKSDDAIARQGTTSAIDAQLR